MSAQPVIFEDHTAADFRPLSWSVPVWELRCGVWNLRERLAAVCGLEPALLPRGFLADLARASGHRVGLKPAPDRILALSARVGANWQVLANLWDEARSRAGWCWRDERGVLAACLEGAAAAAFLAAWRRWDADAGAGACWQSPFVAPPVFDPPLTAAAWESDATAGPPPAASHLWELVPAVGPAIVADVDQLRKHDLPGRRPWGVVPEDPAAAPWQAGTPLGEAGWQGAHVVSREGILVAEEVRVSPGVVIDASEGPIILDRGVRVMPHCSLAGPLYIGAGSVVKAGTRIAGETSIGAACKVAGEIGESTFLDLVNKQHDGFIGHAYLGSWVNLGAMTTCSDLKNNYGRIRIDAGAGEQDTGLRFLGLMMGEHGKTAIGTLFNTGTTVGFASNVFGTGFPPKYLPNFTWGDGADETMQDVERALATAGVAMARRGCVLTPAHAAVFRRLAVRTAP